jgi:uncharacterized phiE125 gp8 family phage protein
MIHLHHYHAIRPQYGVAVAHAVEPVTYDEAAEHCRIDSDADETYLTALISVAREYVESVTGRATTQATYLAVAPCWSGFLHPHNLSVLSLWRSPLVSVSHVKYYAPDAVALSTVSSSLYSAVLTTKPGGIYFAGDLPDADTTRPDAVQIQFVAGHATAAAVPAMLRHAIKLLVAHLYEQRAPIQTGGSISSIPHTLDHILKNQRMGGYFA